ncbi:hypothetical protein MJO28_002139 [Puccinia striiformis f. sp. tritici]|uniref:Ras-GEF domain-containing protein n=3 Tax=Puccinia striiformis TaxID=27350 RepID=A0A2S4VST3_9BASI|nr:hypothetical protein Pst134EA_002628 [Puccinia striiformis f. sp. tritici]KAH9471999.1 hypothetical protein Pst134EA_002628 [Puccinia striiformis f. sp. tritici]KAI7961650.1 hypothetical protein MJO28_002139 [Puccinia striiformis f. sp. tritici]KAI9617754.1 hypothetical protein KEM48_006998 [Puccinia striiformis f. sp. tritici PST-130]POW12577.1 hypothetical protein PSTT_04276 [Puccinia striiformis]
MNFCMILLTCCLGLQEGSFITRFGTVKAVGDLKLEDLSIKFDSAPQISSTPAAVLDDNLSPARSHQGMAEAKKRTRSSEILLEDGSSSSSREESGHAMEDLMANRNQKPKLTISEAEKLVWESSTKHSKAIRDWKNQFLQLQRLDNRQQASFDQRMKDASQSLGALFQQRAYELRGHHDPFQLKKNGELLPTDLSRIIDKTREEDCLRSIADISKTWENYNPDSRISDEATRMIKRGSDLIIDCFVDMKKLGVITKERLSHFLNINDRGELISTYVASSYPAFSTETVYLNFNTRLSLQESLSTKTLVDSLEESTWERVEFTCLKNLITRFLSFVDVPELKFVTIKEWFLKVASPDNNRKPHATELEAFLKFLIVHISSHSEPIRMRNKTSKLIEFKLLYDMLNFTMRYHSSLISTEFWRGIKSSILFRRIRTFEETVGLVSSVVYSTNVLREAPRPTTFPEAASHLSTDLLDESNQLVDSNENRQISSFAKLDTNVDQNILDKESLRAVRCYANILDAAIQSPVVNLLELSDFLTHEKVISNPLINRSNHDLLKNAIEKSKDQYTQYYIQLQILQKAQGSTDPCVFFETFPRWAFWSFRDHVREERTRIEKILAQAHSIYYPQIRGARRSQYRPWSRRIPRS